MDSDPLILLSEHRYREETMGFEQFISESEAASLAGVSVATLNRFAEAGYLEVETESDGLRLFSARELKEVFGISSERLERTSSPPSSPTPEAKTFGGTYHPAVDEKETSIPTDSLSEDLQLSSLTESPATESKPLWLGL